MLDAFANYSVSDLSDSESQAVQGAMTYAINCLRRGKRWWKRNKMSGRIEFRYVTQEDIDDDKQQWEDRAFQLEYRTTTVGSDLHDPQIN